MEAELLRYVFSFATGMLVGAFYFGGLWLTVRRLYRVRLPRLLLFVSYLLRTGITLMAFHYVMDGQWKQLLSCVAGFLVVRYLSMHWASSPHAHLGSQTE